MCGISGIISKQGHPDKNDIIKMNGMISHRGPDQSGYLEYKNTLLGHARLSVIDISDNGRQPMSTDGRYWIIFNGEVYNFLEIKEELIKRNYNFYSKTDTEVVINSYIEWGDACFNKFNGDWVIAILDKQTNFITIARDGLGCKPCYIYEDSKTIAFSSEIKGLLGIKQDLEFDKLNFGIAPTTLFSCSKTIFKNVTQLPPGRILRINLINYNKELIRWWYPLENLPPINPNYEINQGEYYELLYDATKLRLNADLKIGTSLSGGLDSSVIFVILNLIQNNENFLNDKKIDLNPIIVNFSGCQTSSEAVEISKKFKRDLKVLKFKDKKINEVMMLCAKLEVVEEYFMQPMLYQNQKNSGIHISIDGHGADEFLGLPSFLPHLSLSAHNQIASLRSASDDFGNKKVQSVINDFFGNFAQSKTKAGYNFVKQLDLNNALLKYTKSEKFIPDNMLIADDKEILDNFDLATQYIYLNTYCGWMQYFLSKWDRASMSSAVEIRSPFLDKNLTQYSLALPLDKKIKNGRTKSILRDSMEALLPSSINNQKFKQGLPRQKINFEKNSSHKYLEDILNQKDFKEANYWDYNLINNDFKKKQNLNLIWHLAKHYLMLKGFNKIYSSVADSYNKEFYLPNNLKEKFN